MNVCPWKHKIAGSEKLFIQKFGSTDAPNCTVSKLLRRMGGGACSPRPSRCTFVASHLNQFSSMFCFAQFPALNMGFMNGKIRSLAVFQFVLSCMKGCLCNDQC